MPCQSYIFWHYGDLFRVYDDKFTSSKRWIRQDSVTSCNARMALACILYHTCSCHIISHTTLKNNTLGMRRSVVFWNFLISLSAFVPCQNIGPCSFLSSLSPSQLKVPSVVFQIGIEWKVDPRMVVVLNLFHLPLPSTIQKIWNEPFSEMKSI